jgi:anti-sigma regulatory factor (Ser/Thr protein kinase)
VDETQLMQMGLSLHEALNNAIQHGNLGLGSETLHASGDGHSRMMQERLVDPKYAQRRVHLTATISPSEVKLVVRDDGEGFDLSNVPDPTESENLVRPHGRGLYLIGTFMDEMRHNETGNEITMIKRLDPAGNAGPRPGI